MIYADDNADAAPLESARRSYREAASIFADPSAPHALGTQAAQLLDDARHRIASALGAMADHVVLTSGGTEANALALLDLQTRSGPTHVVTSSIEHPSVTRTLTSLAERGAISLTVVPVPRSGRINPDDVLGALRPETRLVTIVLACNETGVLQPIAEIARRCGDHGVPVHTDAVQAAGRVPLSISELGVSLLSLSGHKAGAVSGVGALIGPGVMQLTTITSSPAGSCARWTGAANVAGAVSLASALESSMSAAQIERMETLRRRLEQQLQSAVANLTVVGDGEARLANTSCMLFDGCEGDGLMMALDIDGIAIATGSACSTGALDPSPILLGMGLSRAQARSAVRVSLRRTTSEAEIDQIARTLTSLVHRMRDSN